MTPSHRIRAARVADLAHLADVEASGGQQFVDHFGPGLNPILLAAPSTGSWRAAQPGFLLVAALDEEPPVGFAHVLHLADGAETHAHLEQLSVRPEAQRHGLGTALVHAAMAEARTEGFDRLSLCTYRDVPFNGPFYAGLGFTVPTRLAPYQRRLRDHERQFGLDQDGPRVVMHIALRPEVTAE